VGAIAIVLTGMVVIVALSAVTRWPSGRPTPVSVRGTPSPLRASAVAAHYPASNPDFWDVGVELEGCCWTDRVVHAAMHQAGRDVVSAGFVGYGYTNPDIQLLPDGSLNPGVRIKFRGYFSVGLAAIDVCDNHRCAEADVQVPEAQPG
jgi:hypothetical protein